MTAVAGVSTCSFCEFVTGIELGKLPTYQHELVAVVDSQSLRLRHRRELSYTLPSGLRLDLTHPLQWPGVMLCFTAPVSSISLCAGLFAGPTRDERISRAPRTVCK